MGQNFKSYKQQKLGAIAHAITFVIPASVYGWSKQNLGGSMLLSCNPLLLCSTSCPQILWSSSWASTCRPCFDLCTYAPGPRGGLELSSDSAIHGVSWSAVGHPPKWFEPAWTRGNCAKRDLGMCPDQLDTPYQKSNMVLYDECCSL
jgi:hypothetical protein